MVRSIFIVEPHEDFRQLIGNFLSADYEVRGAKDGFEAMYWLQQGIIPDAIVVGARLSDRRDLITNLRSSGLFSDISIIVIGSEDASEEVNDFSYAQTGVNTYIKRPFNPLTLKTKLAQLGQSKTSRQM